MNIIIDYKKLTEEFNNLPNDTERWKWVKEHQDTGIVVHLDNDDTFATWPDNPLDGDYVLQFNWYIGWSDGVFELLKAYGIRAEGV